MKLATLTTTILLATAMKLAAQPTTSPSNTSMFQPNPSFTLNLQLQQAVCDQDWKRSIKVVDQMISYVSKPPATSIMYKPELINYRGQLQRLEKSAAKIPLELLSGCTSAFTTPGTQNISR
ncbi:hypothetical protein Cri9333_4515 [Crinalium epipsammum PCC 9333]|uniref:Uncharacterized protein n=1 Tax=Crinalium epipsammum PCC 9333 TaxID=1173022 RepID=K9W520_9CYAN|nr:hypothetical protein [Crinalium epipsammum]AFZ15296.1 hypothetical protein Cri9333_4515 [Crinalium epipsammum PCC 9333]